MRGFFVATEERDPRLDKALEIRHSFNLLGVDDANDQTYK